MNIGMVYALFVGMCCALLQQKWSATRAAALRSGSR